MVTVGYYITSISINGLDIHIRKKYRKSTQKIRLSIKEVYS